MNTGLAPTNSPGFGNRGSSTCILVRRLRASTTSSFVRPSRVASHVTASSAPSGENSMRCTSAFGIGRGQLAPRRDVPELEFAERVPEGEPRAARVHRHVKDLDVAHVGQLTERAGADAQERREQVAARGHRVVEIDARAREQERAVEAIVVSASAPSRWASATVAASRASVRWSSATTPAAPATSNATSAAASSPRSAGSSVGCARHRVR